VPPDITCCFVSAIAGGNSADVLNSTLLPGSFGKFLVEVHLSYSLPTKWDTALTIAQDTFVSYPVTIQVQGTVGQ
jgi:hypothetical protein